MWLGGVRGEAGGIHSVGDDGDDAGLERSSQNCIFLAGIRDAYHVMDIRQYHLQELISENRTAVSEPKEGVVSEYSGESHSASV